MPVIDDKVREAAWDELIKLIIKGVTQREAADMLGFHVQTLKRWMNSPLFKAKLARTRKLVYERTEEVLSNKAEKVLTQYDDLERMIEEGSKRALETLLSKLGSPNEHIQLKAAIDLADRNPKTSKTKKIESTNRHFVVNAQQMATIAAAAREIDEDSQLSRPALPVAPEDVVEAQFEAVNE